MSTIESEPWRPYYLQSYYLDAARLPVDKHLTRAARERLLVRTLKERVRSFKPTSTRPLCVPMVVDSESLSAVHVGHPSTFPDGMAEKILSGKFHIIMYEFSTRAQAPRIRRRPSPSGGGGGGASVRRHRQVIEHVNLRLNCSVSTAKGSRKHNEDRHSVFFDACEALVFDTADVVDAAFVGVFDGHAGSQASELVSSHLQNQFREELARQSITEDDEVYGTTSGKLPHFAQALKKAFAKTEVEVLRAAAAERWQAGTTAVCAVVDNCFGERTLTLANLGDSRCVACDSSGSCVDLTYDQTPDSPSELDRIHAEGGVVDEFGYVNGLIAVSRALGDVDESTGRKIVGVSAIPAISSFDLGDKKFEFLILGCDGLWDVMSSQRACDVVRRTFIQAKRAACDRGSAELVREAFRNHTTDNVTALVVSLVDDNYWASKFEEEATLHGAAAVAESTSEQAPKIVEGFVFRGRPKLRLA